MINPDDPKAQAQSQLQTHGGDTESAVISTVDKVLHLGGRAASLTRETPMLGAMPELDSLAVVGLLNAIQERFTVEIDDDEIDGSIFATVGSLIDFVNLKTAQRA